MSCVILILFFLDILIILFLLISLFSVNHHYYLYNKYSLGRHLICKGISFLTQASQTKFPLYSPVFLIETQ